MKWNHLMIDIETMGTACDAPIMSIGAVPFNLETAGSMGSAGQYEVAPVTEWFHLGTSLAENVTAGRRIDPHTVEWWLAQGDEAQKELLGVERVGYRDLLQSFWHDYVEQLFPSPKKVKVWAKPPQFDLSILRHAFEHADLVWPFLGKSERDMRVVLDDAKQLGLREVLHMQATVKHRADYDAELQARQVVETKKVIWSRS